MFIKRQSGNAGLSCQFLSRFVGLSHLKALIKGTISSQMILKNLISLLVVLPNILVFCAVLGKVNGANGGQLPRGVSLTSNLVITHIFPFY